MITTKNSPLDDTNDTHQGLHKRLRDCLQESASLRAKAMRTCDGHRLYRSEYPEKMISTDEFPTNNSKELTKELSLGPLVTAESKLAKILKIPIQSCVSSDLEGVSLDPSSYYQNLPPSDYTPDTKNHAEMSLICSSLVDRRLNVDPVYEPSSMIGRQALTHLLCFYELCAPLRGTQEQDIGCKISQLARVIQKLLRLPIFKKISRSFWEELFAIGLLNNLLEISQTDEDPTDPGKFLYAHHISFGLSFHQEIVSFISNMGPKNAQQKVFEISIVSRCLQNFVDRPDSSINDFLRNTMPTKDFRYYMDMYCESTLMKNMSQIIDSEWLRIFHCIRAGRVDAVLLYKSGFEGINVIVEHIRSMESSGFGELFQQGSEKIALLYKRELEEKCPSDPYFDPFKLAVLLYFSGKSAGEQDVRSGLCRIYQSKIFTLTNQDNFIWIALMFPHQVDVLFLMQHLIGRHPAFHKRSEAESIHFYPLTSENYKFENQVYFRVYQRSFLDALSHVGFHEEVIPMAIYFMMMIRDDPSLPLQSTAFWRDHLLEVFNNFKDVQFDDISPNSFSQGDENALLNSLKRATYPLQSMFANVFLGTQKRRKESYAVVYSVKLLALFSTEQKSDLIVELYISKSMGKLHGMDDIFTNIDSKGIRTSKFFNCMMNHDRSNVDDDLSSMEKRYRSMTCLIIKAAETATKKGFAHISIQLLLDAYVFLVHQKFFDDKLEKNLLNDITQSLMKEVQRDSYRNAFAIIDMSTNLRNFFRSNSDRIDGNVYHEFLTFHKAVDIYREIQSALLQSDSTEKECVYLSKYAIQEYVTKMDVLSIQVTLEKCEIEFEDVYQLVRDETDLATHGTWIRSALRECCLLFIYMLSALQESSQTKFSLRSHPHLHNNITRFLVWTRGIALHKKDESILREIRSLGREFLGQTNLS